MQPNPGILIAMTIQASVVGPFRNNFLQRCDNSGTRDEYTSAFSTVSRIGGAGGAIVLTPTQGGGRVAGSSCPENSPEAAQHRAKKQPSEVEESSPQAQTRLENPCDDTVLPSLAHVSLIARMSSTAGTASLVQPQRRTSCPFTVELGRAMVEPSAVGALGPSPKSKGSPSKTPETSKLENTCACAPCASSNAETAVAAAVVESIF